MDFAIVRSVPAVLPHVHVSRRTKLVVNKRNQLNNDVPLVKLYIDVVHDHKVRDLKGGWGIGLCRSDRQCVAWGGGGVGGTLEL